MSKMTKELSAWLDVQMSRGCTPDALIAAMIKVGHAKPFATQTVEAAFAAKEPTPVVVAQDTIEILGERFTPEQVREHIMNSPNAVHAADRAVHVLFAMAHPRVVLFGNLLSAEECEALIAMRAPTLPRRKTR
jgi:prolyl 4-hydroxylase